MNFLSNSSLCKTDWFQKEKKKPALKGGASQRDIQKPEGIRAPTRHPSLLLYQLLLHLSDHSRGAKELCSRARYLIFMSQQLTKWSKSYMELYRMQPYEYMTIKNIKATSLEGCIANDWVWVSEPLIPPIGGLNATVGLILFQSTLFIWGCCRGLSNSHKTLH